MSHKRSGFSLVLSLAIMASMVMMVIVLAAFLQVETRLAQSHSGYMRARLNAMAAAKIALGQLQQLAGPDQRVTMRADMYDKGDAPGTTSSTTVPQTGSGDTIYNPSAPKGGKLSHQKRYWTGVWCTGGADSSKVRDWDVMNPHNSRLFLGWLSSPCYISDSSTTFFEIAEYKNGKPLPNYLPNRTYFTPKTQTDGVQRNELTNLTSNDGQVLIDSLGDDISATPDAALVPLLSRGSITIPSSAKTRQGMEYYGQVDALPVPLAGPTSDSASTTLGINGRYAFWIGDEGIKAKANLPDAYATVNKDGTGYKTPLNTWDDGFRGSAAQRNAIELIAGTDLKDASVFPSSFSWGTWRTADVSNASTWDATTIARVKDKGTLILWANTSTIGSTAGGDAMKDGYKALFHDVTPWSYSTITDTYNGGIKSDLSTAFELPYSVYRGLEMSYGQKTSTDSYTKKSSLFHDADFAAIGSSSTGNVPELGAIDFNHPNLLSLDFVSAANLIKSSPRASEWAPSFTSSILGTAYTSYLLNQNATEVPERMGFVYEVPLRSAFYAGAVERDPYLKLQPGFGKNSRIERGPTWDLYRNYYRMYKRELEACGSIQGQPAVSTTDTLFARGSEPLSYSSGGTNSKYNATPYNFLSSGGTASNIAYRYNLRTEEGAQYSSHQRGQSSSSYYPTGGSSGALNTKVPTVPWQTSMKVTPSVLRLTLLYSAVWTNQHLGISLDPLIVVHNPYDCAIEFSGLSLVTSEKESSHVFDFYWSNPFNGNKLVQIGDIFPAETYELNHQISFRAIAGTNGTTQGSGGTNSKVFTLQPGEVRVIGATNDPTASLDAYSSVDIPCDFVYTQGSTMFIPMDAYAADGASSTCMQYRTGAANAVAKPIDPTKLTTYAIFNTSATSDVSIKQNVLIDNVNNYFNDAHATLTPALIAGGSKLWNGTVAQLNNITGGTGICIKVRNQDGPNFRMNTSGGNNDYILFPTPKYNATGGLSGYNTKSRGSGHVVDGGSQEFAFYLQYDTSQTGQPLNKYRHWFGPTTLLNEDPPSLSSTTASTYAITNNNTVNESLVLSLKAVTTGWPLYGNAAKGYGGASFGIADPEFGGSIVGFDWGTTNDPPLARTLPDILGGSSTGTAQTSGAWPTFTKANSNQILSGKQPFFACDFLVRGATECDTKNIKNIYYGVTTSAYQHASPSGSAKSTPTVPNEIMTSLMTPFAWSTRAQAANYLGYDGKSAAPVGWICSQRLVKNGVVLDIGPGSRNNGYWGSSVSATGPSPGQTNVILFPIPRRPLLSLAQLGSAATSEVSTDPDLTVGSSFASPGIKDLSKISDWPGTKSPTSTSDPAVPENGYFSKITSTSGISGTGQVMRHYAAVRTDAAFAANLALWDSFWFSGFNALAKSYADGAIDWSQGGPNLPIDKTVEQNQKDALTYNPNTNPNGVSDPYTISTFKTALDSGRNPLANKRVAYRADSSQTPGTMQNTIFPDYLSFPHPTYIGRRSLYDGGFNVNSTSKAAWKAVLGAMKTQKMPDGTVANGTALTRFARAFGTNNGASKPWEAYHDITDTELDALAANVVNEVRRRGPFMSLSDFVNRRLINDDNFGLKGALQAAIDAKSPDGTTMNDAAIDAAGGTLATEKGVALSTPYLPIAANDRFPSARAMSNKKLGNTEQKVIAGLGAPGIISQMDILNSVGPNLTARSDTFVIRAFGEAFDNNGNSIGKAWVEVVTQRSSDFLAFTDQAAQSLKVSAEPTVRDQTYRNNTGASSDYDTKPILDKYRRNNKTNTPTMLSSTEQLINLNRILGRRFNAVSLRWLNPQDI